jgi:nitrite reductase/ring-hydroxylating ferredoxin subunit
MIMRGLPRYVEDLVRSRRPRRFRVGEADAALARTAVTLRAARPGSGAPRDEFVTALHKRLAAELDLPARRQSGGARRAFLRNAAVVGGAAAAGAAIDHVVTAGAPAGPPAAGGTLIPGRGAWHRITASADLPDGTVRPFTAGVVTGFVEREGGRLRAVSGVCTHQGCLLTIAAGPPRLVCPCHGATFALDGSVLGHRLPVTLSALPRLAVREVDGAVQVYAPVATPTAQAGHISLP